MPTEQATRRGSETAEAVSLKLLMHRWDETAPFLSEVLFSDVVTLDAFRALAATARVQDAIEIATSGSCRSAWRASIRKQIRLQRSTHRSRSGI